jgi:hypothetical protein
VPLRAGRRPEEGELQFVLLAFPRGETRDPVLSTDPHRLSSLVLDFSAPGRLPSFVGPRNRHPSHLQQPASVFSAIARIGVDSASSPDTLVVDTGVLVPIGRPSRLSTPASEPDQTKRHLSVSQDRHSWTADCLLKPSPQVSNIYLRRFRSDASVSPLARSRLPHNLTSPATPSRPQQPSRILIHPSFCYIISLLDANFDIYSSFGRGDAHRPLVGHAEIGRTANERLHVT